MNKGYIYIMTNPCLHNMVKIGYTTNVEARRKSLSTTALPYEYEVYATYETSGSLEDTKLHKLIDSLNPDLRVSKNREFFVMSESDAFDLLDAIATISGTKDKLKKLKKTNDKTKQKTKRPPINFAKCGIPVGAELVFIENPSIKVTVESDRKVIYDNEITSLSAVVTKLKGIKSAQGPSYFSYNGRPIVEIAEETQWKA